LAADGAAGVARALELLRDEMRIAMSLSGHVSVKALTRDVVFRVE